MMECIVFPSSRRIREYIASKEDTLLPKLYTMEEFLRRIVVVESKAFVDDASRVLYLYRAIRDLDLGALGFEKDFAAFLKNSTFIFRFFEEMFAEQVEIKRVRDADVYADFEDHLNLLEKIYENYAKELEKDGLVDRITMDEYRLNEKFLERFSRIDIYVDGYLSRFEIGILDRINVPLFLHFAVTPFNRKLISGIEPVEEIGTDIYCTLEWSRKRVVKKEPIEPFDPKKIDVAAFSERIDQVPFVLKTVERFVSQGADPDRIAVIVPDESFADYLRLFDTAGNFNYAMGTPFTQSPYYRRLADLYDALCDRSASAKEKAWRSGLMDRFAKVSDFYSFLDFLDDLPVSSGEREAIEENRYLFGRLASLLGQEAPINILHIWLQRLKELQIDDVGGGRITVMGVLESRGKSFDGVVIVDFNEDIVPQAEEKDLFLNSSIRYHSQMPTRSDKENLQKNYYYLLLLRSKHAAICYVKNEERSASRFLKELGVNEAGVLDYLYRPIIASECKKPSLFEEIPQSANPFRTDRRLTPTKLKDFLVCARRFYYRYMLKIKEEEEEEKNIGVLIHASLEAAAKKKADLATVDEYFSFVMDHIYRHASGAMQRLEISIEWETRLRRFCELDFHSLQQMRQQVIEGWCEVKFEGFTLGSKIDRVDVSEERVRAIDYKTSKKVEKLVEEENDFQLLFYRLWAESVYPEKEIETLYFDIFEGREIYVETSSQIGRLKELLGNLSGQESMKFEKTDEKSACLYCIYKRACGRE